MEKRLSVIFKFRPLPFSLLLVIFVILQNVTISQGAVRTVCWSFSRISQILLCPSVPCEQHTAHFPDLPIFPGSNGSMCTACWSLSRIHQIFPVPRVPCAQPADHFPDFSKFSCLQGCRVPSQLTFPIFPTLPISKGVVCTAWSLSRLSQIFLFPTVPCTQPGHFPNFSKFTYVQGCRVHSLVTFPIIPNFPISECAVCTAWSRKEYKSRQRLSLERMNFEIECGGDKYDKTPIFKLPWVSR